MSNKTVKMVNKWGHEFECAESEVERYTKVVGATLLEEPKKEKKENKEKKEEASE